MIAGFKPIMTRANVNLLTDHYLPTLALGFGNAPTVVSAAATHYGHARLTYAQAVSFMQSHPNLSALAYLQRNFSTMAVPFTTMLSVMNRDLGAFKAMAGLPPFGLFPWFFVLPGLIMVIASVVYLRRTSRLAAGKTASTGRGPATVLAVIGLLMIVAAFAPMPPGFRSIWTVAPQGASMLSDFAGPVSPGGPPVMSAHTVEAFDGYLAKMKAGDSEIVPMVQDVAALYGKTVSTSQAVRFVKSDPALSQVAAVMSGFPAMYRNFHNMLTTMAKDLPDYKAVAALPPFTLFPWFFILPGAIVALAGWRLRGSPVPSAQEEPKVMAVAL